MKRIFFAVALMSCVSFAMPALAQDVEQKAKGASQQAYEHADDNAIFNRTTDWFATIGKSGEEKEKILAERKAERAVKRAEKEAKKAQRKAGEEMKKVGKELDEAGAKAKKKMEGASKQAGKEAQGLMKMQEKAKNK